MAIQRLLIGTVVGGIVLFFLGYLIFGIALADFYATNVGTATGVAKDPDSLNFGAIAVGQLAAAAALTLILSWAAVRSIGQGATIAGIVGLLFFAGVDWTMYGTTNTQNLTVTLVDPFLVGVLYAVAGAAIAAATGKKA